MKQIDSGSEEAWRTMKNLIDLRKTQGLTQKDVANLIGIGESGVTNLERRYSLWTVPTMERYAKAIGYRIRIVIEPR
jgi:transcriptional regulator with XRE-family HTH domain